MFRSFYLCKKVVSSMNLLPSSITLHLYNYLQNTIPVQYTDNR